MNKVTEDILRLQAINALLTEIRHYVQKDIGGLTAKEYADCVCSLLAAKQLLSFPFSIKGTEGLAEANKAKVEMLCAILKAPTIEQWEANRIEQGLD